MSLGGRRVVGKSRRDRFQATRLALVELFRAASGAMAEAALAEEGFGLLPVAGFAVVGQGFGHLQRALS